MKPEIPVSHPRRASLELREKLVHALDKNVAAKAGLIAHGRGEAFDYLLGEATSPPAVRAAEAAAALLLSAQKPVISVNGNVAALCPDEIVALSRAVSAPLEVNLFYHRSEREQAIAEELLAHGADRVLGVGDAASATVPGLESARTRVDPEGLYGADVVFLALEDGDRTEWLVKTGKKVIAVDLNPFSRTAQFAHVTIVDNLSRALPLIIARTKALANREASSLSKVVKSYDNKKVLGEAIRLMYRRLKRLARQGVFVEVPHTGDAQHN
ncbi:MAG: phosphopantothenate/pantothenate synthetase [Spirochaetales bacterium]|nr:phosphopantothenate/pantothenate synthetase [Spirochaetales bacterium]